MPYSEGRTPPWDLMGVNIDQHEVGVAVYQFMVSHFSGSRPALSGEWDGETFTIACGEDMAAFLKVIRSPEGERLFKGLFEPTRSRYKAPAEDAVENRQPVAYRRACVGVDRHEFAEVVALGRKAAAWSQAVLARHAGVHILTVSNIEKGASQGRPETREAIMAALAGGGVVVTDDEVKWEAPVPDGSDSG